MITGAVLACGCAAQTAGPLSPATVGNNASVGSTDWGLPMNAVASNDQYATVVAKGISHYLTTTDFGFSIPSQSVIMGIQLDVERSTHGSSDVALLDAWSTGLNRTVSSGINRCLLVAYAQENGIDSRDITAMSYGGRAMTQVAERVSGVGGGFNARVEVWMLLEADIALAGSTSIVPTYGSYSPFEFCDAFSAAIFQNVDQLTAVTALLSGGDNGATNPQQLGSALPTLAGGMAVNVVTGGNNTTPAISDGGTNTYTINSGYTEGTDLYFANTTAAPTSGACIQTAHKAITADGSEQPSCTFAGGANRWAMIGLTLQRARELDQRVQLIKGGSIVDPDYSSGAAWPPADAYTNYGSAADMWG
ncbi:MAG TPA: hypothetical protein PK760_13730, partial [Flavobacteriales bacterium]|nr:hypothetical protein [Flavobacteriales bacterium]